MHVLWDYNVFSIPAYLPHNFSWCLLKIHSSFSSSPCHQIIQMVQGIPMIALFSPPANSNTNCCNLRGGDSPYHCITVSRASSSTLPRSTTTAASHHACPLLPINSNSASSRRLQQAQSRAASSSVGTNSITLLAEAAPLPPAAVGITSLAHGTTITTDLPPAASLADGGSLATATTGQNCYLQL